MISNTDSTFLIYPTWHIRVKAYNNKEFRFFGRPVSAQDQRRKFLFVPLRRFSSAEAIVTGGLRRSVMQIVNARMIQVRYRSHATYSRQPRQVRKEATVTGSYVCSESPVPDFIFSTADLRKFRNL
jgi:hypothetical protein